MEAISRVETTWPVPAMSAARAVSAIDQPRWRAISVIGTQWSGTIVCSTPTAATAAISRSSGAKLISSYPAIANAAGGLDHHQRELAGMAPCDTSEPWPLKPIEPEV